MVNICALYHKAGQVRESSGFSSDTGLEVSGLTMRFGGLTAVDNVSFAAPVGRITAVIGPNGAGKTTLFNCLTGFYRPTAGTMRLTRDGATVELAGLPVDRVSRMGLARTFQNIRLFDGMTVLENMMVAQHGALMRASLYCVGGLLGTQGYRAARRRALETARFWLDRAGLLAMADRAAGELPYGLQRRLEIARALATGPVLLCLDEPAAGLNPRESAELRAFLASLRDEHKLGILLIEHDMSVVMEISDRVLVLDYGRAIAMGSPQEVRATPLVIRAYLGEPDGEGDAA